MALQSRPVPSCSPFRGQHRVAAGRGGNAGGGSLRNLSGGRLNLGEGERPPGRKRCTFIDLR